MDVHTAVLVYRGYRSITPFERGDCGVYPGGARWRIVARGMSRVMCGHFLRNYILNLGHDALGHTSYIVCHGS